MSWRFPVELIWMKQFRFEVVTVYYQRGDRIYLLLNVTISINLYRAFSETVRTKVLKKQREILKVVN